MNRRHWLKAIAATIAALVMPKPSEESFEGKLIRLRREEREALARFRPKYCVEFRTRSIREWQDGLSDRSRDLFRANPWYVKYLETIRVNLLS